MSETQSQKKPEIYFQPRLTPDWVWAQPEYVQPPLDDAERERWHQEDRLIPKGEDLDKIALRGLEPSYEQVVREQQSGPITPYP